MPSLPLAGQAAAAVFGALSRLRGAKSLHPHGVAFDAVLAIDGNPDAPPASLLRDAAEHTAVVRFSRSVGLPTALPDFIGISLRLPDVHGPGRHQDLLLVTSVDAPVLHHGFVPVKDAQSRVYSSALPYRAGDESFLIGARPVDGSPRPGGRDELDRLRRASAMGDLRFELCVAPVLGRFRRVGELRVGDPLAATGDRTPFNVWNTGGGLEPSGILQRVRRSAYRGSQAGWSGSA